MGLFPHPAAPCLRNPEKELERKLQRLRAESKKRPIFSFRPRPGSQDAVTSGLHGDIVDATGNWQHLQDYHEKVLDAL
jgi:predicted deacylase